MWIENNQVVSAVRTSEALLTQILPSPSNQIVTNRFVAKNNIEATCKPVCSGNCEGFVA